MKVVYVGDNRNRGNFGCRATSTALSQLIRLDNEIVGRVTGKYTHFNNGNLFFINHLPEVLYKKLGKIRHWADIKVGTNLFFNMIRPHGKVMFSSFDFLTIDNLDKSIEDFIRCLPANPDLKEFDLRQYDFDAMVVNGEGSFIFSTPAWRESITITMLMHWAQKLGKKVYFTNAMFSDSPTSAHNKKALATAYQVLKKCELVTVREEYSYEYAKKYMPELNPVIIPDALFTWYDRINDDFIINDGQYFIDHRLECDEAYDNFDFSKPYICISGSSVSGAYSDKKPIIDRFVYLINKTKKRFPDYNVYVVETCEGDAFILEAAKQTNTSVVGMCTPLLAAAKILANASLYITGRYHPCIMSSLGGTPCVMMSSNSHKTISIQEVLEYENPYEYPFMFSKQECEDMLSRGERYINEGNKLREKIKSRAQELSRESEKLKNLIK